MERVEHIVGIAGGSGSGKTYLARALSDHFKDDCCIISQDSYYIDQSDKFDHDGGAVNFDHPSAIDFNLLASHLEDLSACKEVQVPIYDFATHKRLKETILQRPKRIILVDGILIFSQKVCVDCFSMKIFVETSEELRFQRRLRRDVEERGRTPDGVRAQFFSQVKPMHDQFVEPSKVVADYVLKESDLFSDFLEKIIKKLT